MKVSNESKEACTLSVRSEGGDKKTMRNAHKNYEGIAI